MSEPENIPEHCPGVGTEQSGKADACAGCPNQVIIIIVVYCKHVT